MNNRRTFFKYVIPSIIAFALSGVYAIVDGYFVGNTIGDAGISAINIAYPIVALIQAVGTGLIPFIRNFGSSNFAMAAMLGGFITNIILDFLLVWVFNQGMTGAALATIIGQGVTFVIALLSFVLKRKLHLCINVGEFGSLCKSIFKVGLAPFGLALTPNISLVIINRFSASYGGEKAIATYACISYIICIIYIILQGVGDGSQPLMSKYYGENRTDDLAEVKRMAYAFAVMLAFAGCVIMYLSSAGVIADKIQ